MDTNSFTVVIPTLNAVKYLPDLLPFLPRDKTLFIDSSSNDGTIELIEKSGYRVVVIDRTLFNHGGTRNLCLKYCDTDFIIFMTQDAKPVDNTIFSRLLTPFLDTSVAATYAKQLPREGAQVLESLDREFKYPSYDIVQSKETEAKLGSRTYFLSNSCAAYRLSVFQDLQGFPETEIMGEDTFFAHKAIASGYKIVYTFSAKVLHSHKYSLSQLFKRYFDMGVCRSRMSEFSNRIVSKDLAQGSSYSRDILAELVRSRSYLLIVNFLANTIVSLIGYSVGKYYFLIPNFLRMKLSMHSFYWLTFRPNN